MNGTTSPKYRVLLTIAVLIIWLLLWPKSLQLLLETKWLEDPAGPAWIQAFGSVGAIAAVVWQSISQSNASKQAFRHAEERAKNEIRILEARGIARALNVMSDFNKIVGKYRYRRQMLPSAINGMFAYKIKDYAVPAHIISRFIEGVDPFIQNEIIEEIQGMWASQYNAFPPRTEKDFEERKLRLIAIQGRLSERLNQLKP